MHFYTFLIFLYVGQLDIWLFMDVRLSDHLELILKSSPDRPLQIDIKKNRTGPRPFEAYGYLSPATVKSERCQLQRVKVAMLTKAPRKTGGRTRSTGKPNKILAKTVPSTIPKIEKLDGWYVYHQEYSQGVVHGIVSTTIG